MWLILCSTMDASALWAYESLKQMGLSSLQLVTAENLASASRWEHRLSGNDAEIRITLADGRCIDGAQICGQIRGQIRGVLNRLHAPSELAIQRSVPSDRPYAQAEMQAFYLSWLHALPGVVINRPTPIGLCGSWLHPSEWTMRACRAGLRTPVYRQSAHDAKQAGRQHCRPAAAERSPMRSLIALRGQIFGNEAFGGTVPPHVAKSCANLAEQAETELLGIDLALDESGQWSFAGATAAPDLRRGGQPLLEHLAQILLEGARS
jgi:hypothetical protein